MYEVDFSKPIHIHFIGIGGISMSGLAEILLKENFTISGSDAKESDLTRHLTSLGAQVFYGQKAENIIPGIDLVVYTAAIHPDNPEFAAAKAAGIPMLTRAELLGQIMRNYNTPIAVSGTHGKTTTTSMLSHMLRSGKFRNGRHGYFRRWTEEYRRQKSLGHNRLPTECGRAWRLSSSFRGYRKRRSAYCSCA